MGKASGQPPADVKSDGWQAQARNRSPAASRRVASRPANRQPRGDVATIPSRGEGRALDPAPAITLKRSLSV